MLLKKISLKGEYTFAGSSLDKERVFSDYPRLKFQRNAFINLCGLYQLSINRSKLIPSTFKSEVCVPYPVEAILSGIGCPHQRKPHYHFHKEFTLNENDINYHVFLNILRIDGRFTICINGKSIDQGIDEINYSIDIKKEIVPGVNTIDIDLRSSSSMFLGITGQIFIDSAPEKYIKNIKIDTNLIKQSVDFTIDSVEPVGSISVISPNNIKKEFLFDTSKFTIFLDDIVVWTPENPFFYQYQVKIGEDTVNGYFNLYSYSIGEKEGINAFLLNNEPLSIKGIRDDYYYPDGLITMPSYDHVTNIFSDLKKIGFNAIELSKRIELPYYYYSADVKGFLVSQEIEYESQSSLLKIAEYLSFYDSVFLLLVNSHNRDVDVENIYSILKEKYPKKLICVNDFKKNLFRGDLDIIHSSAMLRSLKNKRRKSSLPSLVTNLNYNQNSFDKFESFMKKDFIKYSIGGLCGFFLSSLNNPKNGIYSSTFKSRNISSKKMRELLK